MVTVTVPPTFTVVGVTAMVGAARTVDADNSAAAAAAPTVDSARVRIDGRMVTHLVGGRPHAPVISPAPHSFGNPAIRSWPDPWLCVPAS